MEDSKFLEGALREAACFGNKLLLEELIFKGVDVNSKNNVNGWTALHWAAHRNHFDIVALLLKHGADKDSLTYKEESPYSLSSNPEIQKLLGGAIVTRKSPQLPITPNYLKNQPLYSSNKNITERSPIKNSNDNADDELVLKLRRAESDDPDFIEIELPKSELTIRKLEEVCANELNMSLNDIHFIRKLPNTRLRKDKDILRLKDFQELEVVVLQKV